ncbi:hypothetical protein FPQ18DRAFT_394742 [Pyronema domesticum]|nr:hypothetical protein FPQ18DRAFT_394742 [Pyronema domesticum]
MPCFTSADASQQTFVYLLLLGTGILFALTKILLDLRSGSWNDDAICKYLSMGVCIATSLGSATVLVSLTSAILDYAVNTAFRWYEYNAEYKKVTSMNKNMDESDYEGNDEMKPEIVRLKNPKIPMAGYERWKREYFDKMRMTLVETNLI